MNFYKLYPGDYARDTGHLSHAEHGAYFLMLNAYYGAGKPLPSEPERLYRLLHATTETEQASVDYVLSQFWRRTPEGWVNGRAEVELAKAEAAAEVSRANGRKRKPGGIPAGIPSSIPDGIQPDTRYQIPENQIPEPEKEDAVRAREAPLPSDQPDSAFLDMRPFQDAYPKRAGSQPWRQAAAMAQARIREGHTMAVLTEGARRYRLYCEASGEVDTKFVMQARTFLGPELHFLEPWDPPAAERRKTRKEEADEYNWQTLQRLREGRSDGHERPGQVRRAYLAGGDEAQAPIASNGS